MSSRQAALQLRRLARGRLPSELTQPSASRYASSPDTRLPGAAQALFASPPVSLQAPPGPSDDPTAAALEAGEVGFFRRALLRLGGFYSAESTRMRAALRLQRAILEQADDPALLQAFNLSPGDFRCRFALASLHLWLSLVRLRGEGEAGKLLGQELYDHFWAEMETRVRGEGVVVRLSKWMRELEGAFYGSSAAYDAALADQQDGPVGAGRDELASALRRNVYMGDGSLQDSQFLARYVRHQLACLALTQSEAVMAGHLRYGRKTR